MKPTENYADRSGHRTSVSRSSRNAAYPLKALLALGLLALPAFGAFPNGYSYCKVVTTQHTMVSGAADLTNYPLTVVLTDADLKTTGNGGLVNNAGGFDIGFYPDCSGSGTALKWELESYSATTGAIVAHVLRPAFSHTANDTIGMFYGGAFSSFQSTAAAVWDANYKGVWHLPNGAALSLTDSTGINTAANHGATAVAGLLDGAASIGSSHYIDAGGNAAIAASSSVTAEAWAKYTGSFGAWSYIFSNWDSNAFTDGYEVLVNGSTHKPYAQYTKSGGTFQVVLADSAITTNAVFHIVFTYDSSSGVSHLFINGVQQADTHTNVNDMGGNTHSAFGIGQRPVAINTAEAWQGWLDELRLSNIARSPDWILTEYRNQSAPDTYLSLGPRLTGSARAHHSVRDGF